MVSLARTDIMWARIQVHKKGGQIGMHAHKHLDGFWMIVSGRARFWTRDADGTDRAIGGSDLKYYERNLPREAYPLPVGRPCHEVVGVVEESRDERFKPGQRVIASTGAGGMVEFASVPGSLLVPLPEMNSDPSLWVLCQPVGTVIY